jgi:uncharacterized protein
MSDILCIYHAKCADGFTAAWVVNRYFSKIKQSVEFFPGEYQKPPPDVAGKIVYLVDFSYKRPVLLEMAEQAEKIIILDHHKSAYEDLKDLIHNHSKMEIIFDMDRSGAMITWDYFYAGIQAPKLIEHVQDRDLWKFKLDHTREIQASVFSYEYTFENWDSLMNTRTLVLANEGKGILRKHTKDIKELIGAGIQMITIGEYTVPAANLPYIYSSEVGNILSEYSPFAFCYWIVNDHVELSFRSHDNGVDVSEIAKLYGGGGHRPSSGAKIYFNTTNPVHLDLLRQLVPIQNE